MPFNVSRALLATILVLSLGTAVLAETRIENMLRGTIDRLLGQEEKTAPQGDPPATAPEEVQIPRDRQQIQLSFSPLVKKVAPSVVNVYAKRTTPQFRSPFAGDPFFERFFGIPQRRPDQGSLGSGVIVSADGIILTNNHVIERMDEVRIALSDGREFECEIVLKDAKSDLAVLKIEGEGEFKPIDFADSDLVEVGDLVLAIGNPFGVGQTVTSGIVSAVSRGVAREYGYYIQTDAAINPGNSGGALVDMDGRLIGINTMIYTRSGGSIGIGYAVPSNMARLVVNSAMAGEKVLRPWIGAAFQNITTDIAESLALERPAGALVAEIAKDSPAAEAGLQRGDVVLSVNGVPIENSDALQYRLDIAGIGNEAELEVLSRGQRKTLRIALISPPQTVAPEAREMPAGSLLWGARAANLSPALAQEIGLSHRTDGVVIIRVARGSPAAHLGLRPGDIIREINGVEVTDTAMLERLAEDDSQRWRMVIDRGGRTLIIEERGNGFFQQYFR